MPPSGTSDFLAMNQFSELRLDPILHKNLERNLFVRPTQVQAESIPIALNGLDVVATAQTGTGKTLAFILPMLQRFLAERNTAVAPGSAMQIRSLALSPTRELAIQIAETFHKLAVNTGLRAAVVVGGLSEQAQINMIRQGVQLVIATPGRLDDFLKRKLIDLRSVSTVVLDEADRMLDMGFLPTIEKILSVLPKSRQSLFFSATMERDVERLIARHSNNPVRIAVGGKTNRTPDEVDLHLYEVENDLKFSLLQKVLRDEAGSVLVFARTKHGTDRLARKLTAAGMRTAALHGDRTQNQRNQALAGFRDGKYRVLVATDVAARGIHVDSIAHVINFDLPQGPDDFIHRVGRTGRAGQRGSATTFASKAERAEVGRIERECKVKLLRRDFSLEEVRQIAESFEGPQSVKLTDSSHGPSHHNSHARSQNRRPHLSSTGRPRASAAKS